MLVATMINIIILNLGVLLLILLLLFPTKLEQNKHCVIYLNTPYVAVYPKGFISFPHSPSH